MIRLEDIEARLISEIGDIEGTDTNEADYNSILDLWQKELSDVAITPSNISSSSQAPQWYSKAFNYWESTANCPISDDGVLGGYGKLTPEDVKGSNNFLDKLKFHYPSLEFNRVADCGAGIGRVTKNLLLPRFSCVDLVEQSPRLLEASPSYIGDQAHRVTQILSGLQTFTPAAGMYDVIWIQWVIGHLHDLDFIEFMRRCAIGLKPNGFIILKENCPESWTFVVDCDDSSVSRCKEYIKVLANLADLEIVMTVQQKDFPKELYPVYMLALRPITK